jgi:hypothetical protein
MLLVATVVELEDPNVGAPAVDAGMFGEVGQYSSTNFGLPATVSVCRRLRMFRSVLRVVPPAASSAADAADGL